MNKAGVHVFIGCLLMLVAGTSVRSGSCVGIVTATGMSTEIGKIQRMLSDNMRVDTPLSLALDTFGEDLAKVKKCS